MANSGFDCPKCGSVGMGVILAGTIIHPCDSCHSGVTRVLTRDVWVLNSWVYTIHTLSLSELEKCSPEKHTVATAMRIGLFPGWSMETLSLSIGDLCVKGSRTGPVDCYTFLTYNEAHEMFVVGNPRGYYDDGLFVFARKMP